ncbi:MAG: BON domain-containing protein [Legionellales bacterium]
MLDSLKMLCLASLLALSACSTSPNTESTGEYFDSTAITTKVKASLVDQLGTSGFSVKVRTYKDQVQLSGFVDNSMIKERAARVASGVDGVRLVRNNLIVKSR